MSAQPGQSRKFAQHPDVSYSFKTIAAHRNLSVLRTAGLAPYSIPRVPVPGGSVPAMNVTRYKCSVLVVDDDPGIISILTEQLESDFDVLTASSATQAREVLAQRSVDMVLTDLNLPDEQGLSLLDWVRRMTPRTA